LVSDALISSGLFGHARQGWNLTADGRHLHLSVDDLIHSTSIALDKFWIAFPVENGMPRGFDVTCSLLVARPADEFKGTLSFVPTATEVEASATI
jgi:hypothetical protein